MKSIKKYYYLIIILIIFIILYINTYINTYNNTINQNNEYKPNLPIQRKKTYYYDDELKYVYLTDLFNDTSYYILQSKIHMLNSSIVILDFEYGGYVTPIVDFINLIYYYKLRLKCMAIKANYYTFSLLQFCAERIIYKQTVFINSKPQYNQEVEYTYEQLLLQQAVKNIIIYEHNLIKIKQRKLTLETYMRLISSLFLLNAQDMLYYNFADRIMTPDEENYVLIIQFNVQKFL